FLQEYETEGVVQREFLEVPPGFENISIKWFENNRWLAAAHTAHLHWQLSDTRFLLIERVVDAIVCLQRSVRSEVGEPDFCVTAWMEELTRSEQPSLYPWRVIVETSNPKRLADHLGPLSNWLGVGVDLAPRTRIRKLGICRR